MLEGPFFNAHCHLELSHLRGVIPPGKAFTEWLSEIVKLKRMADNGNSEAGAQAGITRLRETGTAVIGDILSMDTADVPLHEESQRDSAFKAILFREMIDFNPDHGAAAVDRALIRQKLHDRSAPNIRQALSPHAPYTVTEPLLISAAAKAAEHGQWLCIHAAETAEETEMMVEGTGLLRDFLSVILPPNWKAPGMRPIAWLEACGCLGPRTLLAHCNDVKEEDLAIMRKSGCSAVVCPGTHVYFNRGEFPLRKLLNAGIPTYLGTDSLASNEDLDMRREILLAAELSGLPVERIAPLAAADRAAPFFI